MKANFTDAMDKSFRYFGDMGSDIFGEKGDIFKGKGGVDVSQDFEDDRRNGHEPNTEACNRAERGISGQRHVVGEFQIRFNRDSKNAETRRELWQNLPSANLCVLCVLVFQLTLTNYPEAPELSPTLKIAYLAP